ncbi:MAG TPA: hypothetical protein ENG05_02860 [Acidilobales archaeon]|nr:hypothetical protein [Acidilobales archaeon]
MNVNDRAIKMLINGSLKGDRKAIAKMITLIEEDPIAALRYEDEILKYRRDFIVLGFSGAPGVGKSSIINHLIRELRRRSHKVAVLALDPTSVISGGSLLGDRVRVRYFDEGTFFRSITTQPESDVPWKVCPIIEFLGSIGYDYIILEHPGAGQVDVRIRDIADILAIVLQPLTGDEIQMLKAGLLELGDIYIINKYDLPQAELFYTIVESILSASRLLTTIKPKVLKVSALKGFGIDDLVNTLFSIEQELRDKGILAIRRLKRILSCAESAIISDVKLKVNNIVKDIERKLIREHEYLSLRNAIISLRKHLIRAMCGRNIGV